MLWIHIMGRWRMKKLIIDKGLLLTDMTIVFKGNALYLTRVLLDTGSMNTIVSADNAAKIGIAAEEGDRICRITGVGGSELVYTKKVDCIRIGHSKVENMLIEIGAMDYSVELDAIIGLDLLRQMKALINMEKLSLQSM